MNNIINVSALGGPSAWWRPDKALAL